MKEITIKVPDNCELKQDGNTYTIVEKKKKPAEWSEEDEKIIKGIIDDIQGRLEDYPIEQLAEIYFKEISWLKCLKERIQPQLKQDWKPSDEQMEALLKLEEMHVLEHEKNQENAHLYMVIKSLKEQLLKLKEE